MFLYESRGVRLQPHVCKTTNQETSDLTQAGKIPSITRGKCWSSRERLRAGGSPGGEGGQPGLPQSSGVGGRHPQAPETSGPEVPLIPWPLDQHSSGPCRSPFPPCSLCSSTQNPTAPTPVALYASVLAHAVPSVTSNHLPPEARLQGQPKTRVQGPQAGMTAPSKVPSLSYISDTHVSVPPPGGLSHTGLPGAHGSLCRDPPPGPASCLCVPGFVPAPSTQGAP